MPDINITVTDKRPVCTAGTTVVCDNSDYIVHWDLDEEWSAYDTKTMRVIYMDSTYADTVFTGDSVALPPVPVPGCVCRSGSTPGTSTPAAWLSCVRCRPCGLPAALPPTPRPTYMTN